jgi:hypothetical protein
MTLFFYHRLLIMDFLCRIRRSHKSFIQDNMKQELIKWLLNKKHKTTNKKKLIFFGTIHSCAKHLPWRCEGKFPCIFKLRPLCRWIYCCHCTPAGPWPGGCKWVQCTHYRCVCTDWEFANTKDKHAYQPPKIRATSYHIHVTSVEPLPLETTFTKMYLSARCFMLCYTVQCVIKTVDFMVLTKVPVMLMHT